MIVPVHRQAAASEALPGGSRTEGFWGSRLGQGGRRWIQTQATSREMEFSAKAYDSPNPTALSEFRKRQKMGRANVLPSVLRRREGILHSRPVSHDSQLECWE